MIRDTLMVIDDSPLDLAILREIFKSLFRVECFEEARAAMAFANANSQRICAVLLDLVLGRQGAGFSVLQQIRGTEKIWDIPVILITSDAKEANVLAATRKGATDFLVKPVNPLTVQERVCGVVRSAWPGKSTILDCPTGQEEEKEKDEPKQEEDVFLLAEHWDRLLGLYFQSRPHFSFEKYRALGEITAALGESYRKLHPTCGLSREDVQLIGRAAALCDVGLLGVPDSVLEEGLDQGSAQRPIYFRHTELGHALFTTGPSSGHPLARYAAEIAYWHHRNYDGSGYPTDPTPNPPPISAQLVRTAMRCMGYMSHYAGYSDQVERTLRALSGDAERIISKDMYQAAQGAKRELADCLSEGRMELE